MPLRVWRSLFVQNTYFRVLVIVVFITDDVVDATYCLDLLHLSLLEQSQLIALQTKKKDKLQLKIETHRTFAIKMPLEVYLPQY